MKQVTSSQTPATPTLTLKLVRQSGPRFAVAAAARAAAYKGAASKFPETEPPSSSLSSSSLTTARQTYGLELHTYPNLKKNWSAYRLHPAR